MRVLHCISSLSSGGAERQLSYLAPELVKHGIDVHIIYLSDGPTPPCFFGTGVILHQIPHSSNYDPRILFGLVSKILSIKPHIIQTWIVQMDVLVGLIAIFMDLKWIIREANSEIAASHRGKKETVRRFVSRWASYIIANSKSGLDYWQKYCSNLKTKYIQNGLPVGMFSKNFMKNNDNSIKRIIYAGRLKEHKNVITLLHAFSLSKLDKNIHLSICGVGDQEYYLRNASKELNISDKTEFLGHIDQESLMKFMNDALLFVNPSTYEGCPNTVLEAIACKCPVAVSSIPAHKEILNTDSAFYFEAKDAKFLSSILRQVSDPMLLQHKAQKATMLLDSYTINRMTKRYIGIYEELMFN